MPSHSKDALLELSLRDLQDSGLNPETIDQLTIETYRAPDQLNGAPVTGYKIPYFNAEGGPLIEGDNSLPFYRVKLIPHLNNGKGLIKYLQPPNSSTHVYLPPNTDPANWLNPSMPLIFTEGEKKAAKACQEGILCAALGGIQNWHCKNWKIPRTSIQFSDSNPKAKYVHLVNPDPKLILQIEAGVAPELLEINFSQREVYICFDNDPNPKTSALCQISAFEFSYWLANQGAKVKQIILPPNLPKLDDFLTNQGEECFAAFWRLPQQPCIHPSAKFWINKLLNQPQHQKRLTETKIATAIINQLDVEGQRYASSADDCFYYFSNITHQLHPFQLNSNSLRQMHLSTFGNLLGDQFGIETTDSTLMSRISDKFAASIVGRQVPKITPRRVSYCTSNSLYYQLSDSMMAKVSADNIEVLANGTDNILFLTDQVEPIPLADLQPLLNSKQTRFSGKPLWLSVLDSINLQPLPKFSLLETKVLLSALFYLNPLFRHWRGLMLPIELVIAEPNAGKTFLYNLRQLVLTGRPSLKNPPLSPKDWYSQIVNAAGMWVCDNFGDPSQELKNLISDELARLTTDPEPKVEMRQLYTNTSLGSYAIDCTFAITAIRNPFWKPDLLQRSIAINLAAIPRGQRNSGWYHEQLLKAGGRALWIIEHLRIAQEFLREAEANFDPNYLSEHRLMHFEQSLRLMGKAFGPNYSSLMDSALRKLYNIVNFQVSTGDPILEALKVFSQEHAHQPSSRLFKASEIVNWAALDLENRFGHLKTLSNPVSLGKYISQHAYDIFETCGITAVERNNRAFYRIDIDKISESNS